MISSEYLLTYSQSLKSNVTNVTKLHRIYNKYNGIECQRDRISSWKISLPLRKLQKKTALL